METKRQALRRLAFDRRDEKLFEKLKNESARA